MAHYTKIITVVGPDKLEEELNSWLNDNQHIKIINISHAFIESHIPGKISNFMERVFTFSALIVFLKEDNPIEIK